MKDDTQKDCPRCGRKYWHSSHTISDADGKTEICHNCGTEQKQLTLAIKFMPALVKREIAFMRKLLANK